MALLLTAPLPAAAPAETNTARAPLTDEYRTLFQDALAKIAADMERWAYTETTIERDTKGQSKGEKVVRYDPSKPYAEQRTLLKLDGKPPTESQLDKFRREQEKRRQHREAHEMKGQPASQSLGDLADLGHTTVVADEAGKIIYEVPLRREGNQRFPPEKFRVLARLDKERRALENVAVVLREPLRMALVVKIKSGTLNAGFATIDPKFAPTLQTLHAEGAGSILFVPVGRSYDLERSDFKRVKPYNERFDVQVGPVKVLDF